MKKQTYRLPDGETTKSATKYVDAWRSIHEPFCAATGANLIGCDPDILVDYQGRAIAFPPSLMVKLNALILGD